MTAAASPAPTAPLPGPTAVLSAFTAGLRPAHIPPRVRERVKDILLDTLASAIAGRAGDETAQIGALAAALGRSDEATVLTGGGSSLAGAALSNAYLVTAVTVCDVHRPTLFHTTPQVVPPALAIAERDGCSGAALLAAIAAGLEVSVRVARAMDYPEFRRRGWHSPGVVGPFGGAAAAGSLLGLDAARQCHAFALAGSQSAGTFAHWGTPTIKFHQARGSLSGLMAALLAAEGFRASGEILAHPDGGLFNAYSNGGLPAEVTGGLGEAWKLEELALRRWPAGSSLQAMITALFALVEAHDVQAGGVERVRIGLSPAVHEMHGALPWTDKFKALLSAPYIASIILHDRCCWLEQFLPGRYADPSVDAFTRQRVQVEPDASLAGNAASVEITMADGRVLREARSEALGDPGNPLDRAQIVAKLREAAAGWFEDATVERLAAMVDRLEDLADVRELMAIFRAGQR
ncbi:MAG: MmgE/PrpD family protein [bacterium]|jgi:2-methylcitrate dehydratase PrpD|nr:MmgE/PrpD family protein [Betaproteobacteria bacterium]